MDQIEISAAAQRLFIYKTETQRIICAFESHEPYVITPDFHPRVFHGDGYAHRKSADSRSGDEMVSISLLKASTDVASTCNPIIKPDVQI